MKFKPHAINAKNNFIMGWYTNSNSLCDQIIEFHNNNPTGSGVIGDGIVDESIKKSLDLFLDNQQLVDEYSVLLQNCCDLYSEKYSFCNSFSPWATVQLPNVQKYDPGGAFYGWHTERTSASEPFVSRHLAYMTYLNTVSDQGETEFYYQKIKIKPEKGLTLIWPTDWTFTHRGIPSRSQTKYIVTGWLNFVKEGS